MWSIVAIPFENGNSFVLLKALLPVCMKHIAQGESQVVNIAWECYTSYNICTKNYKLSYKGSGSAVSVLMYFTLKDVKFNTLSTHLLIKQMVFFDKMCQ